MLVTMLLMSCQHPVQAKICGADMVAMVPGARAPCQLWEGAGEGLPASAGMWDGHTVECPCYLLWALAEVWLKFGWILVTRC